MVIWRQTIQNPREETRCRHMGYSFRLTARVLLYAPSHRQDSTYHSLCYTSRGALGGTRNSSMGSPHEGSIRWPIAPWANTLTMELHLTPIIDGCVSEVEIFVLSDWNIHNSQLEWNESKTFFPPFIPPLYWYWELQPDHTLN